MNTRLKIICILFGLAYLFIIGDTIVQFFTLDMPEEYNMADHYQLGVEMGARMKDTSLSNSPILALLIPTISLGILSLTILGLLIYIPIQTYKVIRSIVKDDIFDLSNIKRIRKIGYSTLIAFVLAIPIYPITKYLYYLLFGVGDLSEYGTIRDDYSLLLFGLLILLFAEILKMSHQIKEENDLTV